MNLGFNGEVVGFYHKYRRGYPAVVVDMIAEAFRLTADDLALDLGCGTGQLTAPLAGRARAVLGIDPEPDMLSHARRVHAQVANVSWLLGADSDIPRLTALLGDHTVAALTVGQALHWMDHEELFSNMTRLLRPRGGIAIVTNGAPLWQQRTAWSDAVRAIMEEWLQTTLTATCGTDEESQQVYARALEAAGYEVSAAHVDYVADLDADSVIGGLFSAMSPEQLPSPGKRRLFANRICRALAPYEPLCEQVRVAMLTGTRV